VSLRAIAVLAFIALLESAQRASMGHTKLKLAMASLLSLLSLLVKPVLRICPLY
jgi:hypothetical protein